MPNCGSFSTGSFGRCGAWADVLSDRPQAPNGIACLPTRSRRNLLHTGCRCALRSQRSRVKLLACSSTTASRSLSPLNNRRTRQRHWRWQIMICQRGERRCRWRFSLDFHLHDDGPAGTNRGNDRRLGATRAGHACRRNFSGHLVGQRAFRPGVGTDRNRCLEAGASECRQ